MTEILARDQVVLASDRALLHENKPDGFMSSLAHFHGSKGHVKPASPHLLSEPAIVAGLAKAMLPDNPKVPWDAWVGNYSLVRSTDQFNTTVHGYTGRFRGVKGTHMVVFINSSDMDAQGVRQDEFVDMATGDNYGVERVVRGQRIVPYNMPRGCVGAHLPKTNPLVPLSHHDRQAHTPTYKAVPVRLTRPARQHPERVA